MTIVCTAPALRAAQAGVTDSVPTVLPEDLNILVTDTVVSTPPEVVTEEEVIEVQEAVIDTILPPLPDFSNPLYDNIYARPYSLTREDKRKWGRLAANTGVLVGAFVGTLFVLECLPEGATAWNRSEYEDMTLGQRWHKYVIEEGPHWDHDRWIFNYVLHPYAGAVYFMAARSCGFNFWRSFLYCSIISNVCWEFGIEAFMERPSVQDLIITPVVGSCLGELFYRIKRNIVNHDYTLCGSKILGNAVAIFCDPVNEVINLFRGSDTRRMHLGRDASPVIESQLLPMGPGATPGFSFTMTF